MFLYILLCHKINRWRAIINSVCWAYLNLKVFLVSDTSSKLYYFPTIVINIFFMFMLRIGNSVFKIVTNMDFNIVSCNKFKQIFENKNEAVIIISENWTQIDYVNNKFLTDFES